jgi:oxepin-CoA hydrolase/3-oxo-5,6-dehydrosuberyl-CoA semialdehyde dehydrogenase
VWKEEKMATHYAEDDWRKPIQKMEVGDTHRTKSRIITRTDVEVFAVMGGDIAPQFLSGEASRESGWKDQLVPGLCTLNIGYGLLIQSGFIADVIAYMETSRMRFKAPVYPGDAIRMETKVTSRKKTHKGWLCEYDWTIRNQDDLAVAEGHNV